MEPPSQERWIHAQGPDDAARRAELCGAAHREALSREQRWLISRSSWAGLVRPDGPPSGCLEGGVQTLSSRTYVRIITRRGRRRKEIARFSEWLGQEPARLGLTLLFALLLLTFRTVGALISSRDAGEIGPETMRRIERGLGLEESRIGG